MNKPGGKPKLRIGITIDSFLIPKWAYASIEQVAKSNEAELVLMIKTPTNASGRLNLCPIEIEETGWLFRFYRFLDERLFLRGVNALSRMDISTLLPDVPVVEVGEADQREEIEITPSDVEKIKAHRLDVLFKLGSGNLSRDILAMPRYGVWAFYWGDRKKIENGLAGFWETVLDWPETGVSLQWLGAKGEGDQVVYESWLFTYPLSPSRNRNYVLWTASNFLLRGIKKIFASGYEDTLTKTARISSEDNRCSIHSNHIPNGFKTLQITTRMLGRAGKEIVKRVLNQKKWGLLFDTNNRGGDDFSKYEKMIPPKDRFWADPHVIQKDSMNYIFIEEYIYKNSRGHISVIEMDADGNYSLPIPILKKDYHLSYPFVFPRQGKYYLVPESSEKRTIDLYECVHFPDQWQFMMTIMKNVKAVDTTLIFDHEKWWLFTGIAANEEAFPQVELCLFHSNTLFTDEWHPHPLNPIVSDVKNARPAGRIFSQGGKLIRPGQYGSSVYGYGINLNQILTLTETDYEETQIRTIKPNWSPAVGGTHTFCTFPDLTIIDALMDVRKF